MADQQSGASGDVLKLRRFVAFLGFFLLLISQFLVSSQPVDENVVFPPYTGWVVAGLILFLASLLVRPTLFWQKISAHFMFSERVFWILAAVSFSALAAVAGTLFQRNYIPVISIWLLGGVCYVYALSHGSFSIESLISKIRNNRHEILTVIAVMAFGAAFRFYKLGTIPRVMDGDEGLIGLVAQSTVGGTLANPFALWQNFGALYLQAINMSIRFLGVSPFALRLLPAIGGILAIPFLYLFARQVGGRRIALLAAILLTVSHTHIHFSRIASVAYIHGTWLAPLELYLLLSGLEKRQAWRSALSGVLLAIHFSVYLTAQVIIGLALAYMLIAFVFFRSWFREAYRAALAFWGGFLITILPETLYILRNTDEFMDRLVQNGTFQSGWLSDTMQATGQSAVALLFDRVVHAFMALIYYPAFDFYGSPMPMLTMISATLFLLGLVVALWRVRMPGYLLLNGYFWGATFSVGLFAIPPSADSYRMLIAFPAALVMAAIGLDQILELFGIGWANARIAYVFSTTSILLSLLILNLWTYYGDFAGQCRYGANLVGRFASYLGNYVKTIESESSIYLLSNSEYFYGSHFSTDYLSQRRLIINYSDPVDMLNPVSGETIIASPDRIEELEIWARANPGGQLHYQYDCQITILMAYQIP